MTRYRATVSTALAASFLAMLVVMPRAGFAEQERFPLPPKEWPKPIEDDPTLLFAILDRFEYRWNDEGADSVKWDAQGWLGGDWNRLWFKLEGEDLVNGRLEERQGQLLYARLIAPFWYLQAGLRYEDRPAPTRRFGVLGLQGLALYWFNVEATAFVSDEGETSARFEAEYDLLFTQRLILQPRVETNLAAQAVEERGIGQGFNDVTLGLRLRYEIKREFAPYIGLVWSRTLGDTADLAEAQGEETKRTAIVAGVRAWF